MVSVMKDRITGELLSDKLADLIQSENAMKWRLSIGVSSNLTQESIERIRAAFMESLESKKTEWKTPVILSDDLSVNDEGDATYMEFPWLPLYRDDIGDVSREDWSATLKSIDDSGLMIPMSEVRSRGEKMLSFHSSRPRREFPRIDKIRPPSDDFSLGMFHTWEPPPRPPQWVSEVTAMADLAATHYLATKGVPSAYYEAPLETRVSLPAAPAFAATCLHPTEKV